MINNPHPDDWRLPSTGVELGVEEAHVWRASLQQNAKMIASFASLLSPDELQRAMSFYRSVDRDRFIVGRGILRKIISVYLSLSPAGLRFTYNEYGKPAVSNDQNNCELNFNLSHSGALVLYAVTRGRAIGIDIERIREDLPTREIATHFFSKDEVRLLDAEPAGRKVEAFFNCWSRKESYIKAIGLGISYPLCGFTVSIARDVAPALLKVDADELEQTRWQMYELKAGDGYASAMVVEKPLVKLRQFHWTR